MNAWGSFLGHFGVDFRAKTQEKRIENFDFYPLFVTQPHKRLALPRYKKGAFAVCVCEASQTSSM